jgi:DnaJ-class molecular chaperone
MGQILNRLRDLLRSSSSPGARTRTLSDAEWQALAGEDELSAAIAAAATAMPTEVVRAYSTLGVEPTASEAEIKKAYRTLLATWHPDRWQNAGTAERERAEVRTKDVMDAYRVIKEHRNG